MPNIFQRLLEKSRQEAPVISRALSKEEQEVAKDILRSNPSLIDDIRNAHQNDLEAAFKDVNPNALNVRENLNQQLGIGSTPKSAQESAGAFIEANPSLDKTHVLSPQENENVWEQFYNKGIEPQRPQVGNITNTSPEITGTPNQMAPIPKNPDIDFTKSRFPKKTTAAIGAGGLLYSLYGGGEDKTTNNSLLNNIIKPSEQSNQQISSTTVSSKQPIRTPSTKTTVPITKASEEAQPENKIKVVEEATDKPIVVNFGENNSINTVENLAQVQRDIQNATLVNQLGKSAEIIGSSIAGAKPVAQELFNENIKQAQQAEENFKALAAKEKDDPNSDLSNGFKEYLKQFGVEVQGNASASTLEKIIPMAYKAFEAKETRKLKTMESEKQREQQKYLQEERLATQKFIAGENAKARKESANIKLSEKQEQVDQKRLDNLGKLLTSETASSRSAFGKAANNLRAAEAIETLVGQYKDRGQLDQRQIAELARSLDTLLSQGQATISGTEKLIPKSARGDLAKMQEYILGIPQGAKQKEFVDRMVETVGRERDLAKEQIKRAQGKILAPYRNLSQSHPEDYEAILRAHGLESLLENENVPNKQEAPSSGTVQDLINSRSEDENRKRLEELKAKYKR